MEQLDLLTTEERTKLDSLSREELVELVAFQQKWVQLIAEENKRLRALTSIPREQVLTLEDQVVLLRNRLFGKSSERRPDPPPPESKGGGKKKRASPVLLPSLRYPELPLVETEVSLETKPACGLCGETMSGMNQTEDAEFISIVPKVYHIVRQKRAKYRCGHCHGNIHTAPCPPRIVSGGAFSDSLIVDVIVSKYADHLPVERYVNQAERNGVKGLPHQTLIEQTHRAADFLMPVYRDLKREIERAAFLHADETTWNMMEGDPKKRWQLWGFFTPTTAYYEPHDTRAGTVVADFLKNCTASHIVSDAYSGYMKPVKEAGKKNALCNAHARRKFIEAEESYPEATRVIELYKKLYGIEAEIRERQPQERLDERSTRSEPLLREMLGYVIALSPLPKSALGKARSYLINHWEGLTAFLADGVLPIDNNLAERGLRGPVIGRKNFFGNHSRRGAATTAVLYSLIESAKLNGLDPYKYLADTIAACHRGESMFTPAVQANSMKVG